jgi:hypothetical protein
VVQTVVPVVGLDIIMFQTLSLVREMTDHRNRGTMVDNLVVATTEEVEVALVALDLTGQIMMVVTGVLAWI